MHIIHLTNPCTPLLLPSLSPKAQCTPYTGFVCSAMIPFNTPVFSNSIPNLEVTLLSTSTLSLLKQIVQHTNPKCAQAFMAYTCATTFPVCTNTTTNENVLRSVMPCQSSCQLVNQACASVAVLQNLLPNCSANITGTDIPLPTSNCLDLSRK